MTTEVPNRCAENLTRRGGDTAPYLTGVFVRREGRARCPHRAVLVSVWNLAFLWSLGFGAWNLSASPALTDLQCYPTNITLWSAKSVQRLVVQATYADGITRDVAADATYKVANSKLVRFDHGLLAPLLDGQTELRVSYKGRNLSIPVTVSNATNQPPISFKLDVMPVFMKAGCNAGSCHGASRGKDGFRLSLFGFDPDGDYYRLTREQIGRRINLALPDESLIVLKGLGAVQHTGGVRFPTNSELHKTLVAWLAAGAINDPPTVPKATGIEIFPTTAVLEGANSVQRFIIRASYSDGQQRDVTRLSVFLSNNESTARLAGDGTVLAGQRGEAFIQARFGEFNVGAQVIVIPRNLPYQWPNVAAQNYIDEAIYAKLKKLRLTPSAVCDDSTFVRRAWVDITGTLPAPADVLKFSQDKAKGKRDRLVDQLLARKEFADLWGMKFAELLQMRSRENMGYSKAALLYF